MALILGIAGKGGTGKTTLAALVIRQLIKYRKGPVLAVDADANANLNEALGIGISDTMAGILSRINANPGSLPAGMTKERYLAFSVHQALNEGEDFDLLVMGGPEGPGCYCYVNNLLRGLLLQLSKNYPYVLIDNEAGLEHLSRRIASSVDILFVTSDPSVRGVRSAGRVKQLVEHLDLDIKNVYLVLTKAMNGCLLTLGEEIKNTGLELTKIIPFDNQLLEFDIKNKPLLGLPDESPAVIAVDGLLRELKIL